MGVVGRVVDADSDSGVGHLREHRVAVGYPHDWVERDGVVDIEVDGPDAVDVGEGVGVGPPQRDPAVGDDVVATLLDPPDRGVDGGQVVRQPGSVD